MHAVARRYGVNVLLRAVDNHAHNLRRMRGGEGAQILRQRRAMTNAPPGRVVVAAIVAAAQTATMTITFRNCMLSPVDSVARRVSMRQTRRRTDCNGQAAGSPTRELAEGQGDLSPCNTAAAARIGARHVSETQHVQNNGDPDWITWEIQIQSQTQTRVIFENSGWGV
jgi:hypothetical protein